MSVGQIHVPEKRRIEAVRMAVRVCEKGSTVDEILVAAGKFDAYYKDGTTPANDKQGASA